MINSNEVKKSLYKSKVMAKFSHYMSGKIYYNVDVDGVVYQFPISTVDEKVDYTVSEYEGEDEIEFDYIELSEDLGDTAFYAEIKGSELNRWIDKAIKSGDFTMISN